MMPFVQTPAFDRLAEYPPVILIGMHRSGTSLLTRLLATCDVHLGCDQSANAESVHVRRINKHTFQCVGTDWNIPGPVIEAIQAATFVAAQADYYRDHLFSGVGGWRYWGGRQWWALRTGAALPVWGWKDPRTSLTLPIWMHLFPGARVISIVRNGIDVAISLHRRQLAKSKRWRLHPDHRDPRGFDFRFCFSIWEVYQRHLLTYRDMIPAAQYTELHYENLLREPESVLRQILERIDVPVNEDRLEAAVETVNVGRLDNTRYAAAYQDVIPELTENSLMRELGYDTYATSKPN